MTRFALAGALFSTIVGTASAECARDSFDGRDYAICRFDLAESDLRMFWMNAHERPHGTFSALSGALAAGGETLVFATNGGMYGPNYNPIGLYVENGEELAAANTNSVGPEVRPIPNFFKKPNGIFYITEGGEAGVMETGDYLGNTPEGVRFATQSGPLLLVDGAIHQMFIPGSSDLNPRNGVCAPTPGTTAFAISEGYVNFHDFATMFRDHLGCRDALFLDGGSASALYAPELGRNDRPGHGGFGPIIGVVEKTPER